ncbi:hypothetical protein [Williamsia sp.]|uniref:hypothetical protein n=1 Tax=Williamsia sp. TaxID=1872085 RepID=UPI002F91D7A8
MAKSAGTSSSNIFSRVSPASWVAIILAVIAIIFVLQNRDSTSITLFWIDVTSPLWFTLLMIFLVGWIVGILTMRGRNKKKEKEAVVK